MKNKVLTGITFLLLRGLISSCQSVKPYQRRYLNDSSMQFGQKSVASFENNAHVIHMGQVQGKPKVPGGMGVTNF